MSAKPKAQRTENQPSIDPEFKALIPPQSSTEQARLEKNLLAEGCRDRLVVWKGKNILLDGHHRLGICETHDLPYDVVEIELADREAAFYWIIDNQLGRRNLTPESVSYLRGKPYNAEKKSHGGDRRSESSGTLCHMKTEEVLANEFKVAPKTIRNDGEFANDVDKITKNVGGDDLKTALLCGEVKVPRQKLHQLAELPATDQQRVVTQVLESGTMPSSSAQDAKPSPSRRKLDKIEVPVEPIELAKALLRRNGPAYAKKVQQAIGTVLAEHQAKYGTTQSMKESERQAQPEIRKGNGMIVPARCRTRVHNVPKLH